METYTQDHRLIQIITPLGKDVLLLQGFTGEEGISKLFHFDLEMQSESRALSFDDIVGKPATIRVLLDDGSDRYINGLIASFRQGGSSTTFAKYAATLVPWLWMLTRTSDCRIFQNLSTPDILEKVFAEHGFSDFSNRLHGSFKPREYCVQYRETDFNFVSRLMEEEGISYFFEHAQDKHTLVMANHPSAIPASPFQPSARYEVVLGSGRTEDVVTEWVIGQEVRPGKYELRDFNFEEPALDLMAGVVGKDTRQLEIYDYPGDFAKRPDGETLAGVRMQEAETPQVVITGSGTCRGFSAGYRFDLKEHYRRDLNKAYVLVEVLHSADHGENFGSSETVAAESLQYANHFKCIPHATPFRPPRITPAPLIHGSQTAMVVGPSGEEIYVDKYGRVKVQFHWDREGKYDERSSCWVRVSQNWAGKRWGALFIPRIGQEVIVDFLEGNPDRPIITGRVYNGGSMPPYDLPAEKTKSTIKTLSSKGAGGFNELRFEDKKGEEQIFIHAEKDQEIRVKNDVKEWIGQDSHLIIKRDQLEKVEGDQHLQVKGDRNEKVDGTVSLKAGMDLQEKVGMKYALDAGMEIHLKAGMSLVVEAGVTMTMKVGGSYVAIGPAGVMISGPMVLINSGGAAGSGAGASPQTPKDPKEAGKAEAGEKAELPPKKTPPQRKPYTPAALVLQTAARNGAPFCEI